MQLSYHHLQAQIACVAYLDGGNAIQIKVSLKKFFARRPKTTKSISKQFMFKNCGFLRR